MYFFVFFDVNFMSEIEVTYVFTLLMKEKSPSKISQDYCNPGKGKLTEKISPPRQAKSPDNFNVLHMFV